MEQTEHPRIFPFHSVSFPPPAPTVDEVRDKDPASSRPTGGAGVPARRRLPGWTDPALGTTPIGETRGSHFHTFEGTKKVCDDADLLPAATQIQALHDNSTEVPVAQTDDNIIKRTIWLSYRRACTLSKRASYISTVLNSNFFGCVCSIKTDLQTIALHQRSASLYTTIMSGCADNTRRSVYLQLWALSMGAHHLSLEDKGALSEVVPSIKLHWLVRLQN